MSEPVIEPRWWCRTHKGPATHAAANGEFVCNPALVMLLPCRCVPLGPARSEMVDGVGDWDVAYRWGDTWFDGMLLLWAKRGGDTPVIYQHMAGSLMEAAAWLRYVGVPIELHGRLLAEAGDSRPTK